MGNFILVTGAAGFIGSQLCERLLKENRNVIGLDNLNSYYDTSLKERRIQNIKSIKTNSKWKFLKLDLENESSLNNIFKEYQFSTVVNLAAQAGVRYSLENPNAYVKSNLIGFNNVIECCRKNSIKNFIYASSSSIYGGNTKLPFSENDPVNHPVSLYAATKRSNELVAHSYSHLYGIPCTGLRLFTVYGPWGRPDMAPMIFTKAISAKKPITIFNKGEMYRDFTFIDDVTEIIFRLTKKPAIANKKFDTYNPNPSSSWAPNMIFNVGNSKQINLMSFINLLEKELGIVAIKNFEKMQKGDVKSTSSETDAIESWIGFKPNTPIELGIKKFINWYKEFYSLNDLQ